MRFLPKIGVDADDVLYECNSYAIRLLNEAKGYEYASISDITSWEKNGSHADDRFRYMLTESFYETQPVIEGAKAFIKELSEIAEIFITTAVPLEFMGIRAKRIMQDFPEVKKENIIFGTRKDLYKLDFCLDDGGHNITASQATYPVLMRQPWNYHLSGLLAVNNYDEFMQYLKHIIYAKPQEETAEVFCLVGPSGSGKTDMINKVSQYAKRPIAFSTAKQNGYINISKEEFERLRPEFFETSVYAGEYYGYRKSDIADIIKAGNKAIMAVDICGALAIKLAFPKTKIVFVKESKKKIIENILKMKITDECKTIRILSLSDEMANESICDATVCSDRTEDLIQLILKRPV